MGFSVPCPDSRATGPRCDGLGKVQLNLPWRFAVNMLQFSCQPGLPGSPLDGILTTCQCRKKSASNHVATFETARFSLAPLWLRVPLSYRDPKVAKTHPVAQQVGTRTQQE